MELSLSFYIGAAILLLAYGSQLLKVLHTKNATGVSKFSYIVSNVGWIVNIIMAESDVKYIAIVGLILSLITLSAILFYERSWDENPKDLLWSGGFASIMVFGVAQAIRSYKASGLTTGVSKVSYLTWVVCSLNIAVTAANEYIFISAVLTTLVYVYVLSRCYLEFSFIKNSLCHDAT